MTPDESRDYELCEVLRPEMAGDLLIGSQPLCRRAGLSVSDLEKHRLGHSDSACVRLSKHLHLNGCDGSIEINSQDEALP